MANQYDDQDEDMEDLEAEGADEDGAEVEEPDNEPDAEPRGSSGGPAKSAEDNPDERTVSSRQSLRDEMERQIAEFLSRGGQIKEIDPNVTADPPRKPESEYGSRPI
jgi:hypothetical protein